MCRKRCENVPIQRCCICVPWKAPAGIFTTHTERRDRLKGKHPRISFNLDVNGL